MFTGVKKVAIYDPATGTVVQLNKIVPDADVKLKSPLEIKDVNKELYYDGDVSYLEFACYDVEYFYQLETWMKNYTQVRAVCAGVDYNLLWEESVTLTVYKTYGFTPGSRNVMIVRLAKERGEHSIYAVSNLLRRLGRFIDDDANEKADNLTFQDDGGTYTFQDTLLYQNYVGAGGGQGTIITGKVVFPISGLTLFAKCNNTGGGGPAQHWDFYLRAYSFADSVLATDTVSDSDDVLELTLPANTYSVGIRIEIAGTDQASFYFPYMGMERGSYLNINY